MRETTLREWKDDSGRMDTIADLMRVTPAAISKMLRQNRDIRIVLDTRGIPTRAYEIRKFPRKKKTPND